MVKSQVAGPGAGATKGMPCTLCPHVGCQHSTARKGVTPCPECDAGTVVLDPVSGPKWRLDCNLCSFMIYLPDNLHAVKLDKERCKVSAPLPEMSLFEVSCNGRP